MPPDPNMRERPVRLQKCRRLFLPRVFFLLIQHISALLMLLLRRQDRRAWRGEQAVIPRWNGNAGAVQFAAAKVGC